MVQNKNLKAGCYFSWSEVILYERAKQVSHSAEVSGGGESAPGKLC